MISISELTGEYYQDEDCVFFRNPVQSAFYYFNSAKLIDLFVDGHMKFVYVFSKKDHDRLKMSWKHSNVARDRDENNG